MARYVIRSKRTILSKRDSGKLAVLFIFIATFSLDFAVQVVDLRLGLVFDSECVRTTDIEVSFEVFSGLAILAIVLARLFSMRSVRIYIFLTVTVALQQLPTLFYCCLNFIVSE